MSENVKNAKKGIEVANSNKPLSNVRDMYTSAANVIEDRKITDITEKFFDSDLKL
ncbi:hypothetical protein VCJ71_12460 [Alteriqipengyuania sp. WL0013]|uniref:hypothetical protein n=1 Tax=Alteriqipengyuania sp. WL0013 TaxID=3110773 RepID=UPI002C4C98BA|nr:hypothetical protein [Alteriqipengyuania sp. WL0013]MEB3416875.1 hypothetical protein [Alteriqipengyuania sp. WL0013]